MTLNTTQLTTSRINRLFRPLRAKCIALAELASASSRKPSITYSQTSRSTLRTPSLDMEPPPLAILQPPESLGSRIHLDKVSLDNLQLSRKIYDVRDAFKNIVQAARGLDTANDPKPSQIMGLAAMCAMIVGEHIQAEIQASQDLTDESGNAEEEAAAKVMDEIYEAVPPHYRSYTVVSDALSLVLETCPHHPTLLTALLDVCLCHHMIPESHRVLHQLFTVAAQPAGAIPCLLSHPAHSNYLTALRQTCCTRDERKAYHRLDDHTFTVLLADALTNCTTGQGDAWNSRAVAHFARELRTHNLPTLLHLCLGIAHSIADIERLSTRTRAKRKGAIVQPVCATRLRARLARWVKSILDYFHSRALTSGNGGSSSTTIDNDDYRAVINFLFEASSLQLHIYPDSTKEPSPSLADTLICLTTYILAAPVPNAAADFPSLSDRLRAGEPRSESYDTLLSFMISPSPASHLFDNSGSGANTPTPPPVPSSDLPDLMHNLRAYARALRAQQLFRFEASLWSNALRHVEGLLLKSSGAPFQVKPAPINTADMDLLRTQLVQRVEQAEARCFGANTGMRNINAAQLPGPAPVAPANPNTVQNAAGDANSEFVWEEMVGCWVQRSPRVPDAQRAPKRRKLQHSLDSRPEANEGPVLRSQAPIRPRRSEGSARESLAKAGPSRSKPLAKARKSAPQLDRTVQSRRVEVVQDFKVPRNIRTQARRRPLSPASAEDSQSDCENVPVRPSSPDRTKLPMRRVTNFGTLVADALMNCIVLHPKPKSKEPHGRSSTSKRQFAGSSLPLEDTSYRPYLPQSDDGAFDDARGGVCKADQLSSDDALNLFAYGSSSPVRHAR